MGRLNEKVAIITGGASGIGAKIAERFLQEGATVIAADINIDGLKNMLDNDKLVGMTLDVTSEEGWEELTKKVADEYGKIDILVNNAGVSTEKTLEHVNYEDWERNNKINGFGAMIGMKYVIPYMVEKSGGSIVNLSSVTALVGMGLNSYTASKGAVRAITKAAATEYGGRGIRINAVFPGVIETPMVAGLQESAETLAQINALTPMRRLGQPEEVANAILFLASDEASYITGAELAIDGGYSAL